MKLHAVGADQEKRARMGFSAYAEIANRTGFLEKAERIQTVFSTADQENPDMKDSCTLPTSALKHSVRLFAVALLLAPVAVRAEYHLAPGDVLEIGAVGAPDLRHRATIDVDGRASLPLVGNIKVTGLTLAELREQLKSQLSTKAFRARETDSRGRPLANSGNDVVTISPEEVMVEVVEYRPIYLNGDVAKPGAQTYRPGMTVRQAIALAGGYDTMRFRSRDPFLDSSDFRADYHDLWTEFAKVSAEIARLQAELDGKSAFAPPSLGDLPLATQVTSKILDLEAQRFGVDTADLSKEKKYLADAIAQENQRISVLDQQRQSEQQDADADAADANEVKANFRKGILPVTRVSEMRRLTLQSATRVLQTTALLNEVMRKRAEFARSLEGIDDKKRKELLQSMQDATVRLNDIRGRIQSVSEKLLYAGMARSQLTRGPGGEPDVRVFRKDNNDAATATIAAADMELMPGDVVDVKLKLEGTSQTEPQRQSSTVGH
jgi:polysaccharide biosynthesis/export protein